MSEPTEDPEALKQRMRDALDVLAKYTTREGKIDAGRLTRDLEQCQKRIAELEASIESHQATAFFRNQEIMELRAKVRELEAFIEKQTREWTEQRREIHRLQAENAELRAAMEGASRVEAAYGLLWNVMTGDKRINQARRLLLETIDKEGQARGLKAASGFAALRQRAEQENSNG